MPPKTMSGLSWVMSSPVTSAARLVSDWLSLTIQVIGCFLPSAPTRPSPIVSLACLRRKSSGSLRPANTPVVMVTQPILTSRPISTPADDRGGRPRQSWWCSPTGRGGRRRRRSWWSSPRAAAASRQQAAEPGAHPDGRAGDTGDLQELTSRNCLPASGASSCARSSSCTSAILIPLSEAAAAVPVSCLFRCPRRCADFPVRSLRPVAFCSQPFPSLDPLQSARKTSSSLLRSTNTPSDRSPDHPGLKAPCRAPSITR